jgi:hypothetical protein
MNIPEHQNLIRDAFGLAATGNASRQDAVRNTQSLDFTQRRLVDSSRKYFSRPNAGLDNSGENGRRHLQISFSPKQTTPQL